MLSALRKTKSAIALHESDKKSFLEKIGDYICESINFSNGKQTVWQTKQFFN